jgi:hypothetical protein
MVCWDGKGSDDLSLGEEVTRSGGRRSERRRIRRLEVPVIFWRALLIDVGGVDVFVFKGCRDKHCKSAVSTLAISRHLTLLSQHWT